MNTNLDDDTGAPTGAQSAGQEKEFKTFGEAVRFYRTKAGMTQVELAKKLRYGSASVIIRLENGTDSQLPNEVSHRRLMELLPALGSCRLDASTMDNDISLFHGWMLHFKTKFNDASTARKSLARKNWTEKEKEEAELAVQKHYPPPHAPPARGMTLPGFMKKLRDGAYSSAVIARRSLWQTALPKKDKERGYAAADAWFAKFTDKTVAPKIRRTYEDWEEMMLEGAYHSALTARKYMNFTGPSASQRRRGEKAIQEHFKPKATRAVKEVEIKIKTEAAEKGKESGRKEKQVSYSLYRLILSVLKDTEFGNRTLSLLKSARAEGWTIADLLNELESM